VKSVRNRKSGQKHEDETSQTVIFSATLHGSKRGGHDRRGRSKQLDLFRETLTRPAKVQMLAMLGLSDPKRLDTPQDAEVAVER
jgi:hypothetical protein